MVDLQLVLIDFALNAPDLTDDLLRLGLHLGELLHQFALLPHVPVFELHH